jgi:hypothetical protein
VGQSGGCFRGCRDARTPLLKEVLANAPNALLCVCVFSALLLWRSSRWYI